MSLADIFERYPTQESCISHLERIRWKDNPHCPYCASINVAQKQEGERIGRWNCHDCKSSFNVLSGTMFQNTHIPLQKWFFLCPVSHECQEKPIQPPVRTRFIVESKDYMVYADPYSRRNGISRPSNTPRYS